MKLLDKQEAVNSAYTGKPVWGEWNVPPWLTVRERTTVKSAGEAVFCCGPGFHKLR